MAAKLAQLDYYTPYDLFHDLKLTCGLEIVNHAVGSSIYKDIDLFFVQVTELLLKEVERIGLALFHEMEREDEDDMLEVYREEFDRISRNLLRLNQEVVTLLHKYEDPVIPQYNGLLGHSPPPGKTVIEPLFSGLTGRSALDPRNTLVPDPYLLAKVVCSSNSIDSTVMKSFNFGASRIPAPSSDTQILDNFFHPNWYTVEAPKWLVYKQKTLAPSRPSKLVVNKEPVELRTAEKISNVASYAPCCDLKNCVISQETKLSIWFSDIGYERLKNGGAEVDLKAALELDETKEAKKTQTTDLKDGAAESAKTVPTDRLYDPKSNVIKLENLALFNPEAMTILMELRDEKNQINSIADLQRVISSNIARLQSLRQERHQRSNTASHPSALETACYKKVMKLLTILVDLKAVEGKVMNLPISKKLPVLLNDYPGVLPGAVSSKVVSGSKTARLASIRATYKKKGRFG